MTQEFFAGRRVLVTGAGGFIGSHLVEALIAQGAQVTAMLRYGSAASRGHLADLTEEQLEQVRWAQGDITDAEFVRATVADHDTVFHLAALIAIPYSYLAPRSYLRTNVEGTLNVLEAVRQTGVPKLVHTSTSEVYGSARFVPMDESHPLQGQSPYSASKIGADKMAEAYWRSFGTPAVTVRPFNTFGPRQSARAVIPATILQGLWCREVRLGSMAPVRDMTYVSDTVSGFLAAAATPGLEGKTFNLGTGEGHAVGDIVRLALRLLGREGDIQDDPARHRPAASEVDRLVSSNDAFRAATGWMPRVGLEEGLVRTIAWLRARGRPADPGSYAR
ncbi:MAG TPA: SDR family NAD(P)-dependent oxidoreductase [Pseudorhodoferax sp.]|nr:SDR family NAD(P)-dependent oxidoreductase [Pseudorhodoferax sp.]